MPRPGPRPYECVRRAWHSDRHQPIRGSIVQQIFRSVNENHSAATRKNKEWQEKLPIVVLKAEEILYSKANSEAEYSDLDTLWDRVNDAINTIIRRDESTETGELLPPCIEAALNLGCVPVRASRSQRHTNPRSYLNPRMHEPVAQPARVLDKSTNVWHQQSLHSRIPLNAERATSMGNLTYPLMGSNCFGTEDSDFPANQGSCNLFERTPVGYTDLMVNANNKQLNLGCVYPLYYGNPQCPLGGSQLIPQVQENSNSRTIFVGKPVHMPIPERFEMGALQNLFPCSMSEIARKRIRQEEDRGHDNPSGSQCDLSLRLGLFSDSCTSNDKASARETEDVGSLRFKDRGKVSDCSRQNNTEFQFLVGGRINEPWESCTSKRSSDVEDWNLVAPARKRKEHFNDNAEDGQRYWFPNLQLNQFHGQIRRPGL